jgi:hypothetical protein
MADDFAVAVYEVKMATTPWTTLLQTFDSYFRALPSFSFCPAKKYRGIIVVQKVCE